MSLQIELKKSAVLEKQPFPSDLALGEIALNYNAGGPFLTCKDTAGNIRKITGVWVAASAPSSPTTGDLWLDISSTPVFKIYTGSAWTAALTVSIATTAAYGTVRLATAADISNGIAGKVVDAAQLASRITTDITTALSADPFLVNNLSVNGNTTIGGNLVVNGTTTTINATTLLVEDKNIEMGAISTPTDFTANGGGITLKGSTEKTINWLNATDSWTSSENIDLASGKTYRINNAEVLSNTTLGSGVTTSNLTSVGIIASGTWQATPIANSYIADSAITSNKIANNTIVNDDINDSAAIVDTKLDTISTIGKVSNSATTATSANTANAIVARDASGDFTAGTITAALTGNASTASKLSSSRAFALTGDITGTVDSDLTSGVSIATTLASGVIANEDVSASAAIAFSKLQDVSATDRLLGRSSAGAGAVEEIACTAAGRALLDDVDAAAQRTTLGVAIGVDVQAYDADIAKLDTAQSFTALQTFTSGVTINSPYVEGVTIVPALDIDCSAGNYFTKTVSGDSTFTFSNPVASGSAYAFTLEVQHASGVITWPSGVKWSDDTAPLLNTGKTHLFMFTTKDGGARWRGAALVNYVD